MRIAIGIGLGALLVAFGATTPAHAGSQCFKNLDKQELHISLRYRSGRKVDMKLSPGEKRRFDDVNEGDTYCYSFSPIGRECTNRNPVHMRSCSNSKLM